MDAIHVEDSRFRSAVIQAQAELVRIVQGTHLADCVVSVENNSQNVRASDSSHATGASTSANGR